MVKGSTGYAPGKNPASHQRGAAKARNEVHSRSKSLPKNSPSNMYDRKILAAGIRAGRNPVVNSDGVLVQSLGKGIDGNRQSGMIFRQGMALGKATKGKK